MNRGQLRSAVYTRGGINTNDGMATSTVVNDAVNEANHALGVEHDWPWHEAVTTFTTTAGDDSYTVPADWRKTKRLRITGSDGHVLRRVEIDELEDTWDDTTQGTPQAYAIYGDSLFLRPVPSATVTVQHRYIKTEADFDDDNDTPLAPTEFHGAIVEAATSMVLRRLRRNDEAGHADERYERWMARMRDDTRRHTGPSKVRSRGW